MCTIIIKYNTIHIRTDVTQSRLFINLIWVTGLLINKIPNLRNTEDIIFILVNIEYLYTLLKIITKFISSQKRYIPLNKYYNLLSVENKHLLKTVDDKPTVI